MTNLTVRCTIIGMKKRSDKDVEAQISEVMGVLGKRSAEARQKAWGKREFKKRMKEWGKLGGRPRKADTGVKEVVEARTVDSRVRTGKEPTVPLKEVKAKYGKESNKARRGRKEG